MRWAQMIEIQQRVIINFVRKQSGNNNVENRFIQCLPVKNSPSTASFLLFQGLEVLEKKRSASLLPSHAQKAASHITLLLSKVYSYKNPLRTFLSTNCLEC